jgi:hypothetical protein
MSATHALGVSKSVCTYSRARAQTRPGGIVTKAVEHKHAVQRRRSPIADGYHAIGETTCRELGHRSGDGNNDHRILRVPAYPQQRKSAPTAPSASRRIDCGSAGGWSRPPGSWSSALTKRVETGASQKAHARKADTYPQVRLTKAVNALSPPIGFLADLLFSTALVLCHHKHHGIPYTLR